MPEIIAEETSAGLVPPSPPGTDPDGPSETERKLADGIRQSWAAHVSAQAAVKKTKTELKAIRQQLAKRLCQMKQLLVKRGRKGGWSAFLRSGGIAKPAADRHLVCCLHPVWSKQVRRPRLGQACLSWKVRLLAKLRQSASLNYVPHF